MFFAIQKTKQRANILSDSSTSSVCPDVKQKLNYTQLNEM